ncbi:LamG-like jellyroll fold domain-containing protein [Kribbella deserti]|uniref:LamG-like jellyroll fold domain-containing protein n=1 Tax=Kribbella deserti TaxID=1926257 RepID=A0ABV6QNT5_9ACTN
MLTALALLAAGTVAAQADEPPDGELPLPACPTFTGDPSAADEFEAYKLALACGVNVEVLSLRGIDRQAFATPAGMLDTQIAVEPYWVQNADGAWVDIDPALVARPDGSAQTAATVIRVETGAGGTAPFVTATDPDGGVLSLTWPKGPLPKPVISGSVATFPNVLPDVDLAVQAEAVGFSWVLVVKTQDAANNPELATIRVGITTVGLTVSEDAESGRIEVLNADGDVVFEAGQGIMWDSSTAGTATAKRTATAGRMAEVDVRRTATGLTMIPDATMLADPNLKFPLYIDPPFTSTRKAWANVFQGRPTKGWTGDTSWPRSGGMRVGRDTWSTCGDGCGLWRSAIKLDIGKLKGKYIDSASVNMLQTHTGGCGDQGLQLWRTGEISNGTSWNGINWWYGAPLQSKSVPSSNTTGCSGKSDEWVKFDGANIKKRVQSAASHKDASITFGLRSSNEDSRDAWRRIKTSTVKLHVTYYIYPPHPDRLKVDGAGCDPTESGSPWINERYPTFSARVRTSESESVFWRFRVRKVASESNFFYYRTPNPVAASTQSRKSTTALPDGPYKWQARSDSRQSEAVNSGYTNYCYFRVDATTPTVPEVTGPTGAVTEGTTVSVTVSASDPLVNGSRSGLNRFEYSWTTDTFDQSIASTGTTTIKRPAVTAGRQVLYVRAVDNAGNKSKQKVFTFFAGRNIPKTPMGAWRLGGDLTDDTDHGKNLSVLTSDPAFVADPGDPANVAVEFDGNDCLKAPTAIRTDAAFSVALSVRMDATNGTGYSKVLAQGNLSHSMYQIQHNGANNTWSFSLVDAPGDTYGWKSISVPNPVALGKWLRIVATYDPDAGLSRIYLNGVLAGELAVSFTPWNATSFFSLGCLPTASGGAAHTFRGAVEQVGVWQGLLTATEIKYGAVLPHGEIAHWDLRGDGTDASSFGRDLTLPASAEQGFDPFGRPDGSLVLDGQTCATTSTPIVPADEPFGIGAWVKPVQVKGGRQVLFSQADAAGDGFLMRITADGHWEVGALSHFGTVSMTPMSAGTYIPPKAGWQYVEVQYEGAGRWIVSVDGRKGAVLARGVPGRADGPLTIGCSDKGQGRHDFFKGLIHDVEVWRGIKPVTSLKISPPAELASWWGLEETGVDESGKGRDLTFAGAPRFNDGFWDNPDSALELDGTNYAATATPVVATDESFTVGGWVRLDALDTHQTIVSAAGANATGLRLRFSTTYQRFEFGMGSQDTADAPGRWASGGPAPTVGTWYFVVGSFDLRTKMMRLYVNGELAGTSIGPDVPWKAAGPLVIGAGDTTTGAPFHHLKGRVDDVVVWHNAVSPRAIKNMYGTNEMVA